ncbi:hypothetical protein SS50377_26726 [Spironucleus salmonicida]|uniref:Uncharacterized protein n=1 Tax=Spironucleus salmonicida TaxID=348837 RepID=V6LX52_9EUKA|nr:hypothetical protein SS50377_26726 [Spironucleus salmonicida]|eukprot:EST49197.1 Hypothetical protein SS50377_10413 [Spironucleus salmonicida]
MDNSIINIKTLQSVIFNRVEAFNIQITQYDQYTNVDHAIQILDQFLNQNNDATLLLESVLSLYKKDKQILIKIFSLIQCYLKNFAISLDDLPELIYQLILVTQRQQNITDDEIIIIQYLQKYFNLDSKEQIISTIINLQTQYNQEQAIISQNQQIVQQLYHQLEQFDTNYNQLQDKYNQKLDLENLYNQLSLEYAEKINLSNILSEELKNTQLVVRDLNSNNISLSEQLAVKPIQQLEKDYTLLQKQLKISSRNLKIYKLRQVQYIADINLFKEKIVQIQLELLEFKKDINSKNNIQFDQQQAVVNQFIQQFQVLYEQNLSLKQLSNDQNQQIQIIQEQLQIKVRESDLQKTNIQRAEWKQKELQQQIQLLDLDNEQFLEQIALLSSESTKFRKENNQLIQIQQQQTQQVQQFKEQSDINQQKLQNYDQMKLDLDKIIYTNELSLQTITQVQQENTLLKELTIQQQDSQAKSQKIIKDFNIKMQTLQKEFNDLKTNKDSSLQQFCSHFKIKEGEVYENYQLLKQKCLQQRNNIISLEIQNCNISGDKIADLQNNIHCNKVIQTDADMVFNLEKIHEDISMKDMQIQQQNLHINELQDQIKLYYNDIQSLKDEMKFKYQQYQQKLSKFEEKQKDLQIKSQLEKIIELEKLHQYWEKRARMLEKPKAISQSIVNKTLVKQ